MILGQTRAQRVGPRGLVLGREASTPANGQDAADAADVLSQVKSPGAKQPLPSDLFAARQPAKRRNSGGGLSQTTVHSTCANTGSSRYPWN